MKKLILILAVLLVLGGAGAAGWWLLLRGGGEEARADADAEAEAEAPIDLAPAFLPVPVMTVSVIGGNHVVRRMVVEVALEVHGGDNRPRLNEALPRVIDAFIVELHDVVGRPVMAERDDQTALVKHRLQVAADRAVGPGLVANVLVKSIAKVR